MKFKTILSKFDESLWGYHIPVPEEVAEHFLSKNQKRVVCNIDDEFEFQCAIMPKGKGFHFINVNKNVRKKLGLIVGTEMKIELHADESKYGLPMPEEMETLLELDDEGNELFHALTKGKQRSLLYIIGKPKSANKRTEKAVVVIDYLKAVNGNLDFTELQQAFKDANGKF